jgi:hypothetical protein
MNTQSLQDPFPHLIVDDLYDEDELKLVWQELEFLNHLDKWKKPEETGAAVISEDILKNSLGLFLDGDNPIYSHRNISNILKVNRKILSEDVLGTYSKLSFGYQSALISNHDTTLINYYEDSHYYKRHYDRSIVTSLTWFYKEPKSFFGGDLIFSDFDRYTVTVKNNRAILFPSFIFHEVEEICMPENKPGYGRYCMSQFFMIS